MFQFLKDLVTSNGANKTSHSKFWANIAYATSTFTVGYQTVQNTLTAEIFVGYLAIVGASSIASKIVSMRYGSPASTSSVTAVTVEAEATK